MIYANLVICEGHEEPYEARVSRTVLVCRESKKILLVTVGKMEEGPPATTSRSGRQTTVSCVD